MTKKMTFLLLLSLITTPAFAKGKIQNEDVKSLAEIESSTLTITGNLSSGSACIASPSLLTNLGAGQYIYDSTTGANIPAGTTVVAIPGSCSAGQIQMSAVAAGTATGDTITFGGQPSQLINDTKVYVTANGINEQLSSAITDGVLGGGGGTVGIELLPNPGFESGITIGWSTTGGTEAVVTSGPNLLYGKKTASWTATASGQVFQSSALAVQGLSGGNCSASIYYLYSGSNGDYSLRAIDGASTVLATIALPTSLIASNPVNISFPCGALPSSTIRWQLRSNVSSPAIIYFDNTHLGSLSVLQNSALPASWSGYHTSACTWIVSGNVISDPSPSGVAGCHLIENQNRNFGTVTSYGGDGVAALPGIVFTPTTAGRYSICANVAIESSPTGQGVTLQMADTAGSPQVVMEQQDYPNNGNNALTFCGIYNVATAGVSTTLRLRLAGTTGGTNAFIQPNQPATVRSAIEWSIYALDYSFPTAQLANAVTSSNAGVTGLENVRFGGASAESNCTTSPCTVYDQSSTAVVTRSGTGDYIVAFPANTWSVRATCSCVAGSAACTKVAGTSATNYEFLTTSDSHVDILCAGKR